MHAMPSDAGKSTVAAAILDEVGVGFPLIDYVGTPGQRRQLSHSPRHGYLVTAEIGHGGWYGYLAGHQVRDFLAVAAHGYAVATTLHAESANDAIDVLLRHGVTIRYAASLENFVHVEALGDSEREHAASLPTNL